MFKKSVFKATACAALLLGGKGQAAIEPQKVQSETELQDVLYITTKSGVRALLKDHGETLTFLPDQRIPQDFSEELADLGIDLNKILQSDLTVEEGDAPRELVCGQRLLPGYEIYPWAPEPISQVLPGSLPKLPKLPNFTLAPSSVTIPFEKESEDSSKYNSWGWRQIGSDEEPSIVFLDDEVNFTTSDGVRCRLCPIQEEDDKDGLRLMILTPRVERFVSPHGMPLDLEEVRTIPAFFGNHLKELGIDIQKITSISFKNFFQEIGGAAFSNFSHLRAVYWPSELRTIGVSSFSYTGLMDLDLSHLRQLTTICRHAFKETPLRSILWSPALRRIGACAFSRCLLERVSAFPDSFTTLGCRAFSENSELTDLIFLGENITIDSWAFFGNTNLDTLHFPYVQSLSIANSSRFWFERSLGKAKKLNLAFEEKMQRSCHSKDRVYTYERP